MIIKALILASALVGALSAANAADMPTKAAAKLSATYPSTSGFYFGLGTMGGGGNVNVQFPGVNSASLVTNQISINGIVGYAWNVPGSTMFAAIEQWIGVNNINGSMPGFSFNGPATLTTRFMVGVPLTDIAAIFPSFNLSPPPFPTGLVVTNAKTYVSFDSHFDDVTIDVLGMGANRDWEWAPGASLGVLGQLTSGTAVDVFASVTFPQQGICFGAGVVAGQACTKQETLLKAGVAAKW